MNTLDPDSMNGLGKKVEEESDLRLISAAVSGRASRAQGTLSIMTSGPEEIVKSVRPYFEAMGSHIFYYGEKPRRSFHHARRTDAGRISYWPVTGWQV